MRSIAENESAFEESLRWLTEAVTEASRAGDRRTLHLALEEIGRLNEGRNPHVLLSCRTECGLTTSSEITSTTRSHNFTIGTGEQTTAPKPYPLWNGFCSRV
jgi:hypothetical protein